MDSISAWLGRFSESLLRRSVWFFRERPIAARLLIALPVSAVGLFVIYRYLYPLYAPRAPKTMPFPSGTTIRSALSAALRRAQIAKSLSPLAAAASTVIVDGGIPFVVNIVDPDGMSRKTGVSAVHPGVKARDAFATLPWDTFVMHLSASHALVLNKFPVLPSHCVIVTTQFKAQEAGADGEDLAALWLLVHRVGGLGFFNCGRESGASQPRRHSQFVPFSSLRRGYPAEAAAHGLVCDAAASVSASAAAASSAVVSEEIALAQASARHGRFDLPVDAAVAYLRTHQRYRHEPGEPFTLSAFAAPPPQSHVSTAASSSSSPAGAEEPSPSSSSRQQQQQAGGPIPHAVCMLGGDLHALGAAEAGAVLRGWYAGLLRAATGFQQQQQQQAGGGSVTPPPPPAHNLLLTPSWMMVVARAGGAPEVSGLPVNALAYAGLLLARTPQLTALREMGPLGLLRAAAHNVSATV